MNKKPQVGDPIADFTLDCYSVQAGVEKVNLSNLKGKVFILAFYPKDNTPGCTKEMCAFRDDWAKFSEKGIQVFGISRDSLASHKKFAQKFEFNSLKLLSDADGKLSEELSVGLEFPKRILFVIDKAAKIAKIHEGMPVNAELLEFCASL